MNGMCLIERQRDFTKLTLCRIEVGLNFECSLAFVVGSQLQNHDFYKYTRSQLVRWLQLEMVAHDISVIEIADEQNLIKLTCEAATTATTKHLVTLADAHACFLERRARRPCICTAQAQTPRRH